LWVQSHVKFNKDLHLKYFYFKKKVPFILF
jgi:hypothetical protein